MGDSPLDRLTATQIKVLRLYQRRFSAKEIGAQLGVSENTVKTHLTQAAARLGVGREQAAAMLAAHETPHPYEVSPPRVSDAEPVSAATTVLQAPQVVSPPARRTLLPLRMGSDSNDLPVLARLFWIPGLAIAGAIGFGALASGVHVLSDLVAALAHR